MQFTRNRFLFFTFRLAKHAMWETLSPVLYIELIFKHRKSIYCYFCVNSFNVRDGVVSCRAEIFLSTSSFLVCISIKKSRATFSSAERLSPLDRNTILSVTENEPTVSNNTKSKKLGFLYFVDIRWIYFLDFTPCGTVKICFVIK